MDSLPVEILTKIIDLLTTHEKVKIQLVCKKLFRLARDNNSWKLHCYEQSWAARQALRSQHDRNAESLLLNPTATLRSLGQHSLRDLIQPPEPSSEHLNPHGTRISSPGDLARAASHWDSSMEGEQVDWYSEYVARHGPMSFSWIQQALKPGGESWRKDAHEIKGMGLLKDWSSAKEDRIVAPLDDGTVCIWDIGHSRPAGPRSVRGRILGRSEPGILMKSLRPARDGTSSQSSLSFLDLGEGVSIDSFQRRAYLAVGNILNEIDLETLKVVSQQRYPWSIFALSQETDYSVPLTLATTLSLQIYDGRLSATDEAEAISLRCDKNPSSMMTGSSLFARPESRLFQLQMNGHSPSRIRSPDSLAGEDYAPLFQPGPLSVLHPSAPHVNSIILAGRFPSILCYDRRFFPRLHSTVHSGGRLCSLASVPGPRVSDLSRTIRPSSHNVIACGEYNGRGSLETYSLQGRSQEASTDVESQLRPLHKNRQSAARSKLLSVASHGNRIVYSDSEGNIKWVERNGRSEVRSWNINTSQPQIPFLRSDVSTRLQPSGADEEGEGGHDGSLWRDPLQDSSGEVARKILPTGENLSGDELLVWTGERIGRLRFSIPDNVECVLEEDEEEGSFMGTEVERGTREAARQKHRDELEKSQRYEDMMRRALARQADEVRWMGTDTLG
ncbi:hypothetical protein N7539_006425 [Penicillium diatomitis]|uniref:F-box domain-containing protein n=1 Tax=Penicillium diatomitis TaxID=2819901 RepID=A0A9X0BTD0_9EURO|nr:uncharacterized protein N7539_006425 [Penicillium diatomitis]KAJ5482979.1 hypothetical protein N7539_006425 [Penicillium diatomitis]